MVAMAATTSEKESPKVVALTEEVHSLRGKLRDAQMLQAELQEQLVPVERLKAQIRKEKQMRAQAEQQIETMEGEAKKLNDQIAKLVKDLVAQKGETMKFEDRCLDLEKLCAQLGQSERGAQASLFRAHEREQLSRADAFTSGIAKNRAEEERDDANARAHSKEQQLRALKAEWTVLSNHDAKIQEELVEKRVMVNALQKEKALLQKAHRELEVQCEAKHEALQQSKAEVQALRERSEMLEAERLNLEKLKEWVEARHIPEDPPQTSLELSKALVPIPPPQPADRAMNARLFRSAMDDQELPAFPNYLRREMSCLKSRRDYPRCAHARQMRGRILDASHGPLFAA
ncbi:unnamed protein product [Durusdinium trenchii]|uniref:Uncharacterized protein n=3 Tax=Durusdinium trenchii TaxID=1381693 RepID=A0ABP0KGY1_9DINO